MELQLLSPSAHEPASLQLLSSSASTTEACALQREATTMKAHALQLDSGPRALQLEKAHVQQQRLSVAKINKYSSVYMSKKKKKKIFLCTSPQDPSSMLIFLPHPVPKVCEHKTLVNHRNSEEP